MGAPGLRVGVGRVGFTLLREAGAGWIGFLRFHSLCLTARISRAEFERDATKRIGVRLAVRAGTDLKGSSANELWQEHEIPATDFRNGGQHRVPLNWLDQAGGFQVPIASLSSSSTDAGRQPSRDALYSQHILPLQCPNIHGRRFSLIEYCKAGLSPGRARAVALGWVWPCPQPVPQTCGAWALLSLRSQATRLVGLMARRFTAEKTLGADCPQRGQGAGALAKASGRSSVKGPHRAQSCS